MCVYRILVQSGIHDKFVAAFSEAVSKLKQGHAFDEGVTQGPLINKQSIDKVCECVCVFPSHAHNIG